jgi:hypothetical protein
MSAEDRDDALLAELRRVASQADPVPPELLHQAREALTWLHVDAELAELLADSALERGEPALARSTTGARLLAFASEASDTTIEIELLEEEGSRRLVGQLAPPGQAQVELQTEAGVERTAADELGRFRFAHVPGGRFRLRVARDAVSAVVTSWISV